MVLLIASSTGAGKKTYSQELANQMRAAVFSIDDWMKNLFWQDMPQNPDYQWFIDNTEWYASRLARCEDLILKITMARSRRKENTIFRIFNLRT